MINNTLRVYTVFILTLLFDIYHTHTDDKQYLTGINCLYTYITVSYIPHKYR